jgi:hypothetical protein
MHIRLNFVPTADTTRLGMISLVMDALRCESLILRSMAMRFKFILVNSPCFEFKTHKTLGESHTQNHTKQRDRRISFYLTATPFAALYPSPFLYTVHYYL